MSRFKDVSDLRRLPYFQLEKGLLRLQKGVLDTAVDFHTHLGWNYLFTRPIDLWKKTPQVHHIFPETGNPFDFDHYTARDFLPENAQKGRRELVRPAVDTRGYSASHTIPNMLAEMDRMGITRAVVLPIDFPVLSHNSDTILDAIAKKPESRKRLIPFASLHALDWRKKEKFDSYLAKGARGLKVHPQIQMSRPVHPGYRGVYRLAARHRLPTLFHTGLSPIAPRWHGHFVQYKDYVRVISENPGMTFIFGHAAISDWEDAARIAAERGNVYMEVSGQTPAIIKSILRIAGYEKVLFGSDWPFFPFAIPLAKALLATEGDRTAREHLFHKNAERLLKKSQSSKFKAQNVNANPKTNDGKF